MIKKDRTNESKPQESPNKINILDSSIFNLIAAGEVVERPSSVIKELVENSLDAGATRIEIKIEGGGIDSICVCDNGCGIESSSLEKAFLPHATSKITKAADLESISTLGFRGEALPSIAAVARVKMLSKSKDCELGHEITIENGKILSADSKGSADGTTVTVEKLFSNFPARAKFLRSPRSEESEISNLISRFILANPTVSFKLSADGRQIFHSAGSDLGTALFNIYGKNCLDNVFYVDETSQKGIRMHGFFGLPHYSKPNRTYQTLIINGRYVVDSSISYAIFNIYSNYLMKRQYPFYVLHLEIPLNTVDVNVHPNKMEVRFEKPDEIISFIRTVLTKELLKNNSVAAIFTDSPKSDGIKSTVSAENSFATEKPIELKTTLNTAALSYFQSAAQANSLRESSEIYQRLFTSSVPHSEKRIEKTEESTDNEQNQIELEQSFAVPFVKQERLADVAPLARIVGVIFSAFIVTEWDGNIYLIDQHAAHERLLYDKYMNAVLAQDIKKQDLLLPYVFDVNFSEREYLERQADIIKSVGIELEPFGGNSFKISAVPYLLSEINLNEFLAGIMSKNDLQSQDFLRDKIAKIACKAAVKAGDTLYEDDIATLLKEFSEGTIPLCPHGRPLVVKISRSEIDKWFRRIV